MKIFKIMDIWISMGLIVMSVIYGIGTAGHRFILGYFVTGGWQVLSMLIHAFNGWFCEEKSVRYNYHWSITILIICAPLTILYYPLLLLLLFLLLILSPFMAVWYTWLCYEEVYIKMQRPLAHLK